MRDRTPPPEMNAAEPEQMAQQQQTDIGRQLYERMSWPAVMVINTLPQIKGGTDPILVITLSDAKGAAFVRSMPNMPESVGLLALINYMHEEIYRLQAAVVDYEQRTGGAGRTTPPAELAAEAPASAAAGNCHAGLTFTVTSVDAGIPAEEAAQWPIGFVYDHCNFPPWVHYQPTHDANLAPAEVEQLLRDHQGCSVCFPTKQAVDARVAPGA